MNSELISCVLARERLSARLDGELLPDGGALAAHLATCAECRGHEQALASLTRGFAALRERPEPVRDLWPRITWRARVGRRAPALARIAAAVAGFLAVGGGSALLEPRRAPEAAPHLIERLSAPGASHAFLASLPEYRLLRAVPAPEEPR
jgi:anti-sigma factor RsiW